MPSFADSIFLFVLALLLFGPKKLPVLARELGKWMGEFRRASNEFKMQMEDELRASEQADRQKQIAAMEAAAPVPPPLEEPEHPHLPSAGAETPVEAVTAEPEDAVVTASEDTAQIETSSAAAESTGTPDEVRPVPIATSGSLRMMPPATGLPTPRSRAGNPLEGLIESIPEASEAPATSVSESVEESAVHGD